MTSNWGRSECQLLYMTATQWNDTDLGRCFENTFSDASLAPYSDSMVVANLLDELVLRPRFCVMLNLEALVAERLDGTHTDVLQQQQAQLVALHGTQDLWLPNSVRCICTISIMKRALVGGH